MYQDVDRRETRQFGSNFDRTGRSALPLPKHVRYQAAPHPDASKPYNLAGTVSRRACLLTLTVSISDPISLDISPANGGMSGNQGGWDEGQAPEGQTRRQRTDARSDRGRPAGALERTAEDGVGVAVTAR